MFIAFTPLLPVPTREIYRELTLPPSRTAYNQQGNNLIFEAHNFDGPVLILMLSSVSGKYPCLKHPVAYSSGSYDRTCVQTVTHIPCLPNGRNPRTSALSFHPAWT